MARGNLEQRRFLRAFLEAEGAARGEDAARRNVDEVRQAALDRHQRVARFVVRIDLTSEQRQGIGMPRIVEQAGSRPGLDNFAGVHNGDVVANLGDQAEAVRDEDDGAFKGAAQTADQLHDLCLDGDVERCCRFVGNQDVGLAQKRHGDHHALAHAAGELMRIGGEPCLGIREADARKHGRSALQQLRPA